MDVLGILLPLAIGTAVSSVPIMATIVILLSDRGRVSGLVYFIAYGIGLAAVTIGFTAGVRALPTGHRIPHPATGIALIVLGAGCLLFAVWSFVIARRRGPQAEPQLPGWLRRLAALGPVSTFAVGLVLNLRPKALVLAAAAALAINSGGLTPLSWIVDTAIYLVIALSTVAAPVILVWRDGPRARSVLESTRSWLERNSYIVTSIVVIMLGVVLIGGGADELIQSVS